MRERKRKNTSWGGAEREEDTESEAGSSLWAVSTEPDTGLKPMNREIMTWAEVERPTDWAIQAPWLQLFLFLFYIWGNWGLEKIKQHAKDHAANN